MALLEERLRKSPHAAQWEGQGDQLAVMRELAAFGCGWWDVDP